MQLARQITDGKRTLQFKEEFFGNAIHSRVPADSSSAWSQGTLYGQQSQIWPVLMYCVCHWILLVAAQHHVHMAPLTRSVGRPCSSLPGWCPADTLTDPPLCPLGLGTGLYIAAEKIKLYFFLDNYHTFHHLHQQKEIISNGLYTLLSVFISGKDM